MTSVTKYSDALIDIHTRVEHRTRKTVEDPRFLSEADCRALMHRLTQFTTGGGYTGVDIRSIWTGNIRWARNQVSTSGDVLDTALYLSRQINGAVGQVEINDTADVALLAAVRRAERLVAMEDECLNADLPVRRSEEPAMRPSLFSEATYQLRAAERAAVALTLTTQAAEAGLLSAGYVEIAAVAIAALDTAGHVRYFPFTQARYSVTVRSPDGTGSGWAGMDHYDWGKIDAAAITARAMDKCLESRHSVAIEPGRYTTILEPQAVCDFIGPLFQTEESSPDQNGSIARSCAEGGCSQPSPFLRTEGKGRNPGFSKLGERVVDERITVSADPMDPELGFPPFWSVWGDRNSTAVYHPATWIEHGVLMNLAYRRDNALYDLAQNTGLPNRGAFRMSGGGTSVDEMITTTKRGLLVTRFDQVMVMDQTSQLYRGYTRDGLWLIENGKISKAVRNMVFTESILFALNNIDQLGPPQRVFHPAIALRWGLPQPAIVPPLKIRDFSFTALADAI